jgi:hypothetical protein
MTSRHFLYPLNPKAGYTLKDERGNVYPTSVEGFFECFSDGSPGEFGLATGFNLVKPRDLIWVHFALPVGAIMAVGKVRTLPYWKEEWQRHAVLIDWDWALSKKLQVHPIPYSKHKQRVQTSVCLANEGTTKILQTWLKKPSSSKLIPALKDVTFKPVEVQQRQGQPAFRQALLVAYDFKCAVTGCSTRDVLQAAHIIPVHRRGGHSLKNGIILRADLHNLFDRGLLTFDSRSRALIHASVKEPEYRKLHGKHCPIVRRTADSDLLRQHRKMHTGQGDGSIR